jgi:hypothetical protein
MVTLESSVVSTLSQQLRIAVDQLTYPSESDEPFEVSTLPSTAGTARYAVQVQANSTAISEQTVDTFFGELLDDPQIDRFKALQKLLTANLSGLSVFRVHRGSELDVHVIGKTAGGDWAGVKTLCAET